MVEIKLPTPPVPQPPQQQTVWVPIKFICFKWGQPARGYCWHNYLGGTRVPHVGITVANDQIMVVVDPITAISLGLVTPEELEYPEGILAAFNLLRGHSK